MTNPGYSPKIETPRQAIESGLPCYWHNHTIKVSMEDNPDPDVRELAAKSKPFPEILSDKLILELVMLNISGNIWK